MAIECEDDRSGWTTIVGRCCTTGTPWGLIEDDLREAGRCLSTLGLCCPTGFGDRLRPMRSRCCERSEGEREGIPGGLIIIGDAGTGSEIW